MPLFGFRDALNDQFVQYLTARLVPSLHKFLHFDAERVEREANSEKWVLVFRDLELKPQILFRWNWPLKVANSKVETIKIEYDSERKLRIIVSSLECLLVPIENAAEFSELEAFQKEWKASKVEQLDSELLNNPQSKTFYDRLKDATVNYALSSLGSYYFQIVSNADVIFDDVRVTLKALEVNQPSFDISLEMKKLSVLNFRASLLADEAVCETSVVGLRLSFLAKPVNEIEDYRGLKPLGLSLITTSKDITESGPGEERKHTTLTLDEPIQFSISPPIYNYLVMLSEELVRLEKCRELQQLRPCQSSLDCKSRWRYALRAMTHRGLIRKRQFLAYYKWLQVTYGLLLRHWTRRSPACTVSSKPALLQSFDRQLDLPVIQHLRHIFKDLSSGSTEVVQRTQCSASMEVGISVREAIFQFHFEDEISRVIEVSAEKFESSGKYRQAPSRPQEAHVQFSVRAVQASLISALGEKPVLRKSEEGVAVLSAVYWKNRQEGRSHELQVLTNSLDIHHDVFLTTTLADFFSEDLDRLVWLLQSLGSLGKMAYRAAEVDPKTTYSIHLDLNSPNIIIPRSYGSTSKLERISLCIGNLLMKSVEPKDFKALEVEVSMKSSHLTLIQEGGVAKRFPALCTNLSWQPFAANRITGRVEDFKFHIHENDLIQLVQFLRALQEEYENQFKTRRRTVTERGSAADLDEADHPEGAGPDTDEPAPASHHVFYFKTLQTVIRKTRESFVAQKDEVSSTSALIINNMTPMIETERAGPVDPVHGFDFQEPIDERDVPDTVYSGTCPRASRRDITRVQVDMNIVAMELETSGGRVIQMRLSDLLLETTESEVKVRVSSISVPMQLKIGNSVRTLHRDASATIRLLVTFPHPGQPDLRAHLLVEKVNGLIERDVVDCLSKLALEVLRAYTRVRYKSVHIPIEGSFTLGRFEAKLTIPQDKEAGFKVRSNVSLDHFKAQLLNKLYSQRQRIVLAFNGDVTAELNNDGNYEAVTTTSQPVIIKLTPNFIRAMQELSDKIKGVLIESENSLPSEMKNDSLWDEENVLLPVKTEHAIESSHSHGKIIINPTKMRASVEVDDGRNFKELLLTTLDFHGVHIESPRSTDLMMTCFAKVDAFNYIVGRWIPIVETGSGGVPFGFTLLLETSRKGDSSCEKEEPTHRVSTLVEMLQAKDYEQCYHFSGREATDNRCECMADLTRCVEDAGEVEECEVQLVHSSRSLELSVTPFSYDLLWEIVNESARDDMHAGRLTEKLQRAAHRLTLSGGGIGEDLTDNILDSGGHLSFVSDSSPMFLVPPEVPPDHTVKILNHFHDDIYVVAGNNKGPLKIPPVSLDPNSVVAVPTKQADQPACLTITNLYGSPKPVTLDLSDLTQAQTNFIVKLVEGEGENARDTLHLHPRVSICNKLPVRLHLSIEGKGYYVCPEQTIDAPETLYPVIVQAEGATGELLLTRLPKKDGKKTTIDLSSDTRSFSLKILTKYRAPKGDLKFTLKLFVFSKYWFSNKTGFPLVLKECGGIVGKSSMTDLPKSANTHPLLVSGKRRAEWQLAHLPETLCHSNPQAQSDSSKKTRVLNWSAKFTLEATQSGCLELAVAQNHRAKVFYSVAYASWRRSLIVIIQPYFIVNNSTYDRSISIDGGQLTTISGMRIEYGVLPPISRAALWGCRDRIGVTIKKSSSRGLPVTIKVPLHRRGRFVIQSNETLGAKISGGKQSPVVLDFRHVNDGAIPARIDNFTQSPIRVHQTHTSQANGVWVGVMRRRLVNWTDLTCKEPLRCMTIRSGSSSVEVQLDKSYHGTTEQGMSFISYVDVKQRVIAVFDDTQRSKELSKCMRKKLSSDSHVMRIALISRIGVSVSNPFSKHPYELFYAVISGSSDQKQTGKNILQWTWPSAGMQLFTSSRDTFCGARSQTTGASGCDPDGSFNFALNLTRLQVDNQLIKCKYGVAFYRTNLDTSSGFTRGNHVRMVGVSIPSGNEQTNYKNVQVGLDDSVVRFDWNSLSKVNSFLACLEQNLDNLQLVETDLQWLAMDPGDLSNLARAGDAPQGLINIQNLVINPTSMQVSFTFADLEEGFLSETSGGELFEIQETKLRFERFEVRDRDSITWSQLRVEIMNHFNLNNLSLLQLSMGLDILGSPSIMYQDCRHGIQDLVHGINQRSIENPWWLVDFTFGLMSLARHGVGGTFGLFARSSDCISRVSAKASLDKTFKKTQMTKSQLSGSAMQSLYFGLRLMMFSLISAGVGAAIMPVRGYQKEKLPGLGKGVAKGCVGLIAKPTSGLFDLLSGTCNAVRRVAIPTQNYEPPRSRVPRFNMDIWLQPFDETLSTEAFIYQNLNEDWSLASMKKDLECNWESATTSTRIIYLSKKSVLDDHFKLLLITENEVSFIKRKRFSGCIKRRWSVARRDVQQVHEGSRRLTFFLQGRGTLMVKNIKCGSSLLEETRLAILCGDTRRAISGVSEC